METIKNLSVQMSFTLNFENVEVTESIKEQLLELFNDGKTLSNDNPNIGFEEVWDWLSEQISCHKRADYFEYQIEWIE
jgi:hypothetical protein|nr:MAG TPA: protein of unknown function (DUF5049) [Caudoviricetes sp.]